jgi:hypothetical protein
MADAVPFNYNTFVATFPAFAALPQQQAQLYWNMAGGYWRNDGTSPATTDAEQATLMNLVTAHLAQILGAAAAAAPSAGLVGRMSSASEGSVSVSAELSGLPPSAAFWTQTQYGLLFWQMTAAYRQGPRYRAPVKRSTEPFGFTGPYRFPFSGRF